MTSKVDQWKAKYETLNQERADMEVDYKEKIKDLNEKHKKKIQEIESKYQQQIVQEVERYQELLRTKEELMKEFQVTNGTIFLSFFRSILLLFRARMKSYYRK